MNQEQQGKWKEARKNLLETAKKYPKSLVNVIDSAYLAGLENNSIFESYQAEQVKAIEELSKTWKPCKRKNCDNKEECERANHYIETIWNPTFEKVLSILKKKRQ